MLDVKIPDPPTSPSLISLNGFSGRKAPCFLPQPTTGANDGRRVDNIFCAIRAGFVHDVTGTSCENSFRTRGWFVGIATSL